MFVLVLARKRKKITRNYRRKLILHMSMRVNLNRIVFHQQITHTQTTTNVNHVSIRGKGKGKSIPDARQKVTDKQTYIPLYRI